MTVHHGRHEMPGWRGYLPESVDRSRRRSAGAGILPPGPRRVVALGALAACAVAAGAAIGTRPDGPPGPPSGTTDDAASVLARTSAWTREATPVLASIETELHRTDEIRRRWDGSSLARREPSPPGAVVALVDRQVELAHHRDGLRAALTAVRATPGSESALAVAWPRLRAAQELLRSLASERTGLGDPVEAAVLRLVADETVPGGAGGEPAPSRGTRTPAPTVDAVRVALATTASVVEQPAASVVSLASTSSTRAAENEAPESDDPETVEVPSAPTPDVPPGDPVVRPAAVAPEEAETETETETPQPAVDDEAPEPSMLSFDRSAAGTPDPSPDPSPDSSPDSSPDPEEQEEATSSGIEPTVPDETDPAQERT
ncbi:hypothetical protein EV188_104585 [Actinomycetospora succinea]|uniref:DUF5667 domain-containing protein n=1 Tax=Actinomycetospora succinea TaxID=663603 RepID=A0A4R6VEB5_9PSEU|nr:hypothetical protein [Actinomycetospora succinea]TDQ58838.1 hypothetical protein EV188_104585 [Actinomycetospora succinea]